MIIAVDLGRKATKQKQISSCPTWLTKMLHEAFWSFEMIVDWLQSLKQFFINVPYHILVASLTLMALFKTEPSE